MDKALEQGGNKFIPIPPGAPRTVGHHEMLDERYPLLQYMQGNESTCLFMSVASALHYLHLEKSAKIIADSAAEYAASAPKGRYNWDGLQSLMRKHCKQFQPFRLRGTKNFDILHETSEYPTVVQLEAEDGGIQHAITVVGRLIFDANCQRALPLTMKSLNYCCSSKDKKGKYKRVYFGYRFKEHENTQGKKLMEKLKNASKIDFFTDVKYNETVMEDTDEDSDDDMHE